MSHSSKAAKDRWYRANKGRQIARQNVRRRQLKAEVTAYKRTLACGKCGFSFSERPECCDFHHPDPKVKDSSVSVLVRQNGSKVWAEIAKCVPICANCHRTIHHAEE